MNFASIDFLYFFGIVFCVFYLLPDRFRNAFLLAASYFFYGYWSVKYLLLLIFTMVLDYVIAIKIDEAKTEKGRKQLLIASLVANLGILFVFKYFNLFSDAFAALLHRPGITLDLILPFGISFYTFHAMSYTIDVYRRVIPAERNFTYYSGYVMFFPQLVAGPIARASHLLHQFSEVKRLRFDNIVNGSYLIARGYLMKVVLADNIAPLVDAYFGTDMTHSPWLSLQGIYFFAFQIYFDFSGYTDIARGVAKFFDYELVLNFNRPYAATSITEFWRRWHISLSTWLRDYLYISLGGNRRGSMRTYANLMTTMLLGGLWHGANWTFLFWGGLHGFYLVVERALSPTAFGRAFSRLCPRWVKILLTFHAVCLAWLFFRASTFAEAQRILLDIASFSAKDFHNPPINWQMWRIVGLWLFYEWAEQRFRLADRFFRAPWPFRFAVLYGVIVLVALFAELNPKAFIYFQF